MRQPLKSGLQSRAALKVFIPLTAKVGLCLGNGMVDSVSEAYVMAFKAAIL